MIPCRLISQKHISVENPGVDPGILACKASALPVELILHEIEPFALLNSAGTNSLIV